MPHCPSYEEMHELEQTIETYTPGYRIFTAAELRLMLDIIRDNRQMRAKLAALMKERAK